MQSSRRKTKKGRERAAAAAATVPLKPKPAADGETSKSIKKSSSPVKSSVEKVNSEDIPRLPEVEGENHEEKVVQQESDLAAVVMGNGEGPTEDATVREEIDTGIDPETAGEQELAEPNIIPGVSEREQWKTISGGDGIQAAEIQDTPVLSNGDGVDVTSRTVHESPPAEIVNSCEEEGNPSECVTETAEETETALAPPDVTPPPTTSECAKEDDNGTKTGEAVVTGVDDSAATRKDVNPVPVSDEPEERNKMKLDTLGSESKAAVGGEEDDLTPVNENGNLLPMTPNGSGSPHQLLKSLHVQSDNEEESSSADVWWTAREDFQPGSDDGSYRATSALSTLSLDEVSDRLLDSGGGPGSKRNSFLSASPSSDKVDKLPPPSVPVAVIHVPVPQGSPPDRRDASTLTDVLEITPYCQNGHEGSASVESPAEVRVRKAEIQGQGHRRGSLAGRGHNSLCEESASEDIVDYLVDVQDGVNPIKTFHFIFITIFSWY